MIHIAVCDDSVEFQSVFHSALKKLCADVFPKMLRYEILNCFGSATQVLQYVEQNPVDVLFLDIDMPGMNGLDLARRLVWKNQDTVIVFVSGYDHYVYEVFEFSPFAFLRKDKILDELPKTLVRIADKFEKENTDVKIQTVNGLCTISARDLLYIKSSGNYYYCHEKTGRVLICRGTLSEAETFFSKYDFFRVHSAYLVNLHYIQRIEKNDLYIGLNNEKIPIAQRRLAGFRKVYAEYNMRSFHL